MGVEMPNFKVLVKWTICFAVLSCSAVLFMNFSPAGTSVTPEEMIGKNYVGYQAWFNTPTDGIGRNWCHWGQDCQLRADKMAIDMWPDVSEYPENTLEKTGFILGNGQPAKVFSSSQQGVINLHFKWMKDYSIDGAFLQWFIADPADLRLQIAKKVKTAAEVYNRQFSIMFDISGFTNIANCHTGTLLVECVKQRWIQAVDGGVIDSSSYMKHKGKPLVSIWGIGFTHNAALSPQEATQLIRWFKSEAPVKYQASVMGGVGSHWRTLSNDVNSDTLADAEWAKVFESIDIISPWLVGRFENEQSAANYIQNRVKADVDLIASRGQKYLPVIFAGFSWLNLKKGTADAAPLNKIPRKAGQFIWTQAREFAKLNISALYTAMFDEVDEGTAIFKTSPNASTSPREFTTLNLDADGKSLPSDWYLSVSKNISLALKSSSLNGFNSEIYPISPPTNVNLPISVLIPVTPPPAVNPPPTAPVNSFLIASNDLFLGTDQSKLFGKSKLVLQSDGNLVLYDLNGKPLWASNTSQDCSNKKCLVQFQKDGNLVLYKDGKAFWASNTAGTDYQLKVSEGPPYMSIVNGSGGIILYKIEGTPIVITNDPAPTPVVPIVKAPVVAPVAPAIPVPPEKKLVVAAPPVSRDLIFKVGLLSLAANESKSNEKIKLIMQADGNLVLYDSTGHALWATNTSFNCQSSPCTAVFQGDGNLVLYHDDKPFWASNTQGLDYNLKITSDSPFLTISNSNETVVWRATDSQQNSFVAAVAAVVPPVVAEVAKTIIDRVLATVAVLTPVPAPVKAPEVVKAPEAVKTLEPVKVPAPGVKAATADLVFEGSGLILETNQSKTDGKVKFILQDDGNLVLYDMNNHALWASDTEVNCRSTNCEAIFQGDGNLVIYQNNIPVWASNTVASGAKLKISAGNPVLSIVSASGQILWSQFGR